MNLLYSMKYLVALNELRHFARAAEACYITQPALSNALRALDGLHPAHWLRPCGATLGWMAA